MRWAGYLMIFLAAAGGGFYASLLLEKRKRQLAILKRAVISLNREIDYQLSTLPEAFHHTADRVEEPWKSFWEETGRNLEKSREIRKEFLTLWEDQIKEAEKFHPWKQDLNILKELGKGLGQLDKQMQLAQLKLTGEELLEMEREAEEECKRKGHLYRMLGTCMGVLGIVLLL